jgi:hypothetical protein
VPAVPSNLSRNSYLGAVADPTMCATSDIGGDRNGFRGLLQRHGPERAEPKRHILKIRLRDDLLQ